jgi:murein DD-endopeptidase MepM/ murein hydrolase activator NlpD
MARRLVCSLVFALLLAAPAAGGLHDRKHELDHRADTLRSRAEAARAREEALGAEIASISQRIQSLESEVGDVSSRLASLEHDLSLYQRKLDALKELYQLQSQRLAFLRDQYALAIDRLSARLVAIYEGEEPSTLDVLIRAENFDDLLEQLDYVRSIAAQDQGIVRNVTGARNHMRDLRARTGRTKARVASVTRAIAIRAAQQRAARDRLLAAQRGLSSARSSKRQGVAAARQEQKEFLSEAAALEAESANLAARIRAAQATPTYSASANSTSAGSAPSASGFIWPVSGPVVSPYGMRWGRLHAGIDIAAPYGVPIAAAAAGVVISAGWMGGYGNLVVIDHGGGVATAYAHESSLAVGSGQQVAQGQTIGYIGCTGNCFGNHVHFEVRVNGSPVDPLGYL